VKGSNEAKWERVANRYLVDTVKVAEELVEERRGFVGRDEIERAVRLVMHPVQGAALRSRAAELKQSAAQYAFSNTHLDAFLAGLVSQIDGPARP